MDSPEFWVEGLMHGLICGVFCSLIHLLVDWLRERKKK